MHSVALFLLCVSCALLLSLLGYSFAAERYPLDQTIVLCAIWAASASGVGGMLFLDKWRARFWGVFDSWRADGLFIVLSAWVLGGGIDAALNLGTKAPVFGMAAVTVFGPFFFVGWYCFLRKKQLSTSKLILLGVGSIVFCIVFLRVFLS